MTHVANHAFCLFCSWTVCFLTVEPWGSLYTLDIASPSPDTWLKRSLLVPSTHPAAVVFHRAKALHSSQVQRVSFSHYGFAFLLSNLRNLCLDLCPKDFPLFLLKGLEDNILCTSLWSILSWFLCDVKLGQGSFFCFVFSIGLTLFVKKVYPLLNCSCTLVKKKPSWAHLCGSVSGFTLLFHWSVFLFSASTSQSWLL